MSTARRLTGADKRQIEAAIANAKRQDKRHKSAQDSIPFQRMFPDGICRVTDTYYTKAIQFQDINYQLSQNEDKTAIFDGWCDFLNYFDASVHFQLTFLNMAASKDTYGTQITIPLRGDEDDAIRTEYTQMLRDQLAKGNNGLIKTKYLTFGIEADGMKTAKPRLERIETDILNNFKRLGVAAEPLNGTDRLRLLHDMLRIDDPAPFRFSWDWLAPSGLSVKDFIAPSSFEFAKGNYFGIGQKRGAVSFLQILAPELNDRMLADFLDMESSLIVTMHVQSVDQVSAIKTTIRKTSSELISGVEQQFKEICKERGISLEPAQPAQKQPEQDIEKLYMVDNEKYIHVQRSDTGIDYTIYDAASAKALDGGVLDDTGQLLSAAALTVCKLHNIGDAAPIRLAPLELLNGLQEANELLLGAGEQITGVEATSTADSLPDLPQLEQDYPMPDPTVDFAQMYQFGYTDGNTMLPLSKERARELFLQDVPIFVLNSDNTEYMVLDTSDLDAHSGIFGVERTEWERVRDTLQPRCDIVAPKQPDAVSYLHDDTAKTQPENYLKNAEMALEDDYGMIDGIINNGPKQTVAEQEERSSILAKLKAPVETTNRTEKHAPKRSAEKEL